MGFTLKITPVHRTKIDAEISKYLRSTRVCWLCTCVNAAWWIPVSELQRAANQNQIGQKGCKSLASQEEIKIKSIAIFIYLCYANWFQHYSFNYVTRLKLDITDSMSAERISIDETRNNSLDWKDLCWCLLLACFFQKREKNNFCLKPSSINIVGKLSLGK